MNVTTSARWDRPPVGVVRAERSIARELERLCAPGRLQRFIVEEGRTKMLPPLSQHASGDRPIPGDLLLDIGLDWVRWGIDSMRRYEGLRRAGIRVVTMCYDLIPLLHPQYTNGHVSARFRDYVGHMARGSDLVLCISECTRRDYLAFCAEAGLPPQRTAIVHLGDEIPGTDSEVSERVRALAQQDYLLFVSTIDRRKNHEVIHRALHRLVDAGHGARLPKAVFVGMPGWGVRDLMSDLQLDPRVRGRIVLLDRTSDAELNLLYRNALFCVYPSLYEGWGLPVAEALAMGKVVICSDRGSLPEVGGRLVPYLDPWHVQAWADLILDLATDRARIRRMEDEIRREYRPRTWAQAAGRIAAVAASLGVPLSPGAD